VLLLSATNPWPVGLVSWKTSLRFDAETIFVNALFCCDVGQNKKAPRFTGGAFAWIFVWILP
jgi:hypothetical protein